MAAAEFDQRIEEEKESLKYAQVILKVLSSENFADGRNKPAEQAARACRVKEEFEKAKNQVHRTVESVKEREKQIRRETAKEYAKALNLDPATPEGEDHQIDLSALQQEIVSVQKQTREKEKRIQKLADEQKRLAFDKKQRQLQKRVLAIQFDLASTDIHIKGYLKKPSGALQTFEFDFSKDSPSYVSDFLWDMI